MQVILFNFLKTDLLFSYNAYCTIFQIGGQQNNTWTNKTWIINPKKNFEMTEGPTYYKL